MTDKPTLSQSLTALCDHVQGDYPAGIGPSPAQRVPGYLEARRLADSGALDALLEAAKEAYHIAILDWSDQRQIPFGEAHAVFSQRIEDGVAPAGWHHAAVLHAAIRAIEPGWAP